MIDIVIRAGCFVAIILLGYLLKKIGFFKKEDFSILSRITLRITLPAVIITSFAGKDISGSLLVLVLLGIGCGLIYIGVGYFLNIRSSKEQQAFEMLNLPGYNIGAFVLPFAQGFLGPMGVVATSLFDTGNAVICLGGAYSLAAMVKDGSGFSLRRLVGSLAKSVPFVTYFIMLLINLCGLRVPGAILSCAEIIGSANAFMAMLMIGVGFELSGDRTKLSRIVRILGLRYGIGAVIACIFYYGLPFAPEVRQALVILALSPVGSAVPAFTGELKGDVGLSSAVNSLSILISVAITIVLLVVML